jgi:hypothetical protein
MTRQGLLPGMPAGYRIQIQGYLDGTWSDRLGGLTIKVNSEPINGARATTLSGRLRDQTDLIGVLNTLHDLHLPLLSVEYVDG